jgi:hypothetical protein
MASGWKIITATKRLGGGPPIKEYFLVAIVDRDEAVTALRERRQLQRARLDRQRFRDLAGKTTGSVIRQK